MHRSGTSLVARFFFEAGADLGDANTFYRPDRWNPDGYFEQPEIHAINMPLINGPWGKLAYFRLPSTDTIMKRARRRRDQIAHASSKYRHNVVKETRFCLTLPAWREQGAIIDGVLICLRHPRDVARSLQRRNRISSRIAYGLWQQHLERVLEHTQDIPTRFIRYESLLDEQLAIQELQAPLRDAGVDSASDQIHQLHKKLVRRQPERDTRNTRALPAAVSQLWDELLRRHASQS